MTRTSILAYVFAVFASSVPMSAHEAWVLWSTQEYTINPTLPTQWVLEDAYDSRESCIAEAARYRDESRKTYDLMKQIASPASIGVELIVGLTKADSPDCPCLLRLRWRCLPDTLDMRREPDAPINAPRR